MHYHTDMITHGTALYQLAALAKEDSEASVFSEENVKMGMLSVVLDEIKHYVYKFSNSNLSYYNCYHSPYSSRHSTLNLFPTGHARRKLV